MDADHDIAHLDAEGCGNLRRIHIGNLLDFKIMIAGAQRAHLVALAFFGLLGNLRRIGAAHAAALFDALQDRPRVPKPRSTAQRAPPRSIASISAAFSRIAPVLPMPAGMA